MNKKGFSRQYFESSRNLLKSKRSQVTLFIIIAIILIAGVVTFFVLRQKSAAEATIPLQIQPIYDYIRTCIETNTKDSLIIIGDRGGYYILPVDKPVYSSLNPYYLYNGQNYVPSLEEIEDQISLLVKISALPCFTEAQNISGYNVSLNGPIEAKTSITSDEINIEVSALTAVNKDRASYSIEDYKDIKIQNRLGLIHSAADEFIQNQSSDTKRLCLSCMTDISRKYNLSINSLDIASNTIIFKIIDSNSKINDKDFEFVFVNQYG